MASAAALVIVFSVGAQMMAGAQASPSRKVLDFGMPAPADAPILDTGSPALASVPSGAALPAGFAEASLLQLPGGSQSMPRLADKLAQEWAGPLQSDVTFRDAQKAMEGQADATVIRTYQNSSPTPSSEGS